MGWTGLYEKPLSIPDYFKSSWGAPREDGSFLKCLGQAFVGRFVLYGVWQETNPDGTPKAAPFATVTLIRYAERGSNCKWYYKNMDETVGPNEARCPKTLLKHLGPIGYNDYATAWRKACWAFHNGETKAGRIALVRRYWRRDHAKALALMDKWNDEHPDDLILLYRR